MKIVEKTPLICVCGCIMSLLMLSVAIYSEAVDAVAHFDFKTVVEWNTFQSSMGLVKFEHFNFWVHDILAIIGIVGILFSSVLPKVNISKWGVISYSLTYFATGGFIGLIAITFGWFLAPIDGEFFQDRTPSFLAHGIWGYTLILLTVHKLMKPKQNAEQVAVANPAGAVSAQVYTQI